MNRRRTRPNGRIFNLVQGVPEWRVRNAASKTQLFLYDEISWWGITAADFVSELQDVSGPLELRINSPGGDVYEGIAILNSLRAYPGRVDVVVDGLAASAASVVAMGGETLTMMRNSELMIHDAWGLVLGNAADMRDMAERLDKTSNNIASIYADKAKGTVEEWRKAMLAETWYSADEAVSAGLADKVDGTSADAENSWDLSVYNRKSRPQELPAAAMQASGVAPERVIQVGPGVTYTEDAEFTIDAEAFRLAMEEVWNA